MHCHTQPITSKPRGISLVELLIVIAIATVLAGRAAPALNNMIQRNQAATAINWIIATVNFARHAAVTRNTTVTLCPGQDESGCGGHWHDGVIAFTDADMNRRIDDADVILQKFEFPVEGATLKWRAFQNRQYLQLTRSGYTNWQNGNFLYCPENKDPRFARELIINMPGRARLAADIDGDGIIEDSRGRDVDCGK